MLAGHHRKCPRANSVASGGRTLNLPALTLKPETDISNVEITEKLLLDAGGWQAMKQARSLLEAKRVTKAEWAPPLLSGRVHDHGTEFRAGLKITSRSQVENTCSCKTSRQFGAICAHSLAVGLALLQAGRESPPPADSSPGSTPASGPSFSTESGEGILLHLVIAPNAEAAWRRDSIVVGAEVEHAGKRVLLGSLPKSGRYRCPAEDLALIDTLRELSGGTIPGVLMLNREGFARLLERHASHERMTLGKHQRIMPRELLARLKPKTLSPDAASPTKQTAGEVKKPVFTLAIEGSLNSLVAKLLATYPDRPHPVGNRLHSTGQTEVEQLAINRLIEAGFAGPNSKGEFKLAGERAILRFFAEELPALQTEWKVTIGAQFSRASAGVERIEPKFEIKGSGEDWFELGVEMKTAEGQSFSGAELQRLLQMGHSHSRLKNGRIAVFDSGTLDDLQNVLRDCDPQQRQPGVYRIQKAHAGYVSTLLPDTAKLPTVVSWASAAGNLEALTPIPLGDLEEGMRAYQKHGAYWFNFLSENRLGGILADEMGLGKTLQTLAFLRHRHRHSRLPSLVVCPSSLVFNWQREASRWTPDLPCLAIQGIGRERLFEGIAEAGLAITSYSLLRRDAQRYSRYLFDTVILDEAQHIKNPDTQNAQVASSLRSANRFVLTGTPLENSVRDLWSLMQFVMPGYLGSRDEFRERYELPIAQHDIRAQRRLTRRVRSFLLRRQKRDVCKELPEKLEQVVYCEMNASQRELYEALVQEARSGIDRASNEMNPGRVRMVMLTALLRLRQACCDPRLLDLETPQEIGSAKVEMLDELLQEAIDGGHRVLVFSQFVRMLKLLRDRLDASETPYAYLDGATKSRSEVVDAFQAGNLPVFLISLTAGGTGLNLTAADTVIHFDPWWNPAVEAQATDRAHRIGQSQVVTVYKLIARGTIEEKILLLHATKREMVAATIESEEPMMTGLSIEEIRSLIE
jgi:superfamily II DNA or RNA helicase